MYAAVLFVDWLLWSGQVDHRSFAAARARFLQRDLARLRALRETVYDG